VISSFYYTDKAIKAQMIFFFLFLLSVIFPFLSRLIDFLPMILKK